MLELKSVDGLKSVEFLKVLRLDSKTYKDDFIQHVQAQQLDENPNE